MGFFPYLNQRYDIIICVFLFELVSDVAHGPLVKRKYPCKVLLIRQYFIQGLSLLVCINHV